MKKFILSLAIVATSFGAFAQTPAAKKTEVKTEKKAAHKAKKEAKKAEVKKEATKSVVKTPAPKKG
ncbi:hypothetical protein WG904_03125 [Pedobacter sp. Du54]|uniref:hypothetical protein n=1 Tax=Pedobacter anseongensis TaxID=3133439 RepID=UPI003094E742